MENPNQAAIQEIERTIERLVEAKNFLEEVLEAFPDTFSEAD